MWFHLSPSPSPLIINNDLKWSVTAADNLGYGVFTRRFLSSSIINATRPLWPAVDKKKQHLKSPFMMFRRAMSLNVSQCAYRNTLKSSNGSVLNGLTKCGCDTMRPFHRGVVRRQTQMPLITLRTGLPQDSIITPSPTAVYQGTGSSLQTSARIISHMNHGWTM